MLTEKKNKAPKDMKVGENDVYKAMAHADYEKRQENGAFVKSSKHKSMKDYSRKVKHKKDFQEIVDESIYDMDKVGRWAKKNGFYEDDLTPYEKADGGFTHKFSDTDGRDICFNNGEYHSCTTDFPNDDFENYMKEPDMYEQYGNGLEGIQNWLSNEIGNSNGSGIGQKVLEAMYTYLSSNDDSDMRDVAIDVCQTLDCEEDVAIDAMKILAVKMENSGAFGDELTENCDEYRSYDRFGNSKDDDEDEEDDKVLNETKSLMSRMGLFNEKPEKKHQSILKEHYNK